MIVRPFTLAPYATELGPPGLRLADTSLGKSGCSGDADRVWSD